MKNPIIVQNLKCGGCAHSISSKLSEIDSISDININVETSNISFFISNKNDIFKVKDTLQSLGYPATDAVNSLTMKAKSFVSCATGKFSKQH